MLYQLEKGSIIIQKLVTTLPYIQNLFAIFMRRYLTFIDILNIIFLFWRACVSRISLNDFKRSFAGTLCWSAKVVQILSTRNNLKPVEDTQMPIENKAFYNYNINQLCKGWDVTILLIFYLLRLLCVFYRYIVLGLLNL